MSILKKVSRQGACDVPRSVGGVFHTTRVMMLGAGAPGVGAVAPGVGAGATMLRAVEHMLRAGATMLRAVEHMLRAVEHMLRAVEHMLRASATMLRAVEHMLRASATILRAGFHERDTIFCRHKPRFQRANGVLDKIDRFLAAGAQPRPMSTR